MNNSNYQQFQTLFDEYFSQKEQKRKDYCYDCMNDKLYTQAMAFRCSKCHKLILG